MSGRALRLVAGLALGLLTACAHPVVGERLAGPVCSYDDLVIRADFPSGRLSACTRTAKDAITLDFRPEARPINSSPWYAFSVTATQPRALALTLRYDGDRHRYRPHVGHVPEALKPLPTGKVEIGGEGTSARFDIEVDERPVFVAGNRILDNEAYTRWSLGLAEEHRAIRLRTYGNSLEGRAITGLEAVPEVKGVSPPVVVIVGRQHPPELTGAFTLIEFVETLLGDDPLAASFRKRFALLVLPNLNPDGVQHGHWRLNAALQDLNRDWGPFGQPETRAARDALLSVMGERGTRLALFLDFHATRRTVLYTQPEPAPDQPADFAARWIRAMEERLADTTIGRRGAHSPGSGIAKNWVHEMTGRPAITFEVSDAATTDEIRSLGQVAAREMMRLLLSDLERNEG